MNVIRTIKAISRHLLKPEIEISNNQSAQVIWKQYEGEGGCQIIYGAICRLSQLDQLLPSPKQTMCKDNLALAILY